VGEGQELTFDGSGSQGLIIQDYAWDFGDGSTGNGVNATHTYDDGPNQYTVTLTVTDSFGRTASGTTEVTVNNLPPVADADGPYTCQATRSIQLVGICDDPGPVDAASLTLSWADFSGVAISEPTYLCPDTPGEVSVTLTCTDKDGASAQDTAVVKVEPLPEDGLTADPNGPYTGTVGNPVAFDGSGSTPADRITDYMWDFGDGNTGTGVTPTHTYSDANSYTVTLTVSDGTVQDSETTTADITEEADGEPPTADIQVTLIPKTELCYRFDGSGSSDPDGEIVAYDWDMGDGMTDTGELVEYCYEEVRSYKVTLTVTDDDGLTGSVTTEVTPPEE
jgi:PKD repeat protein